MMHGMKFIYIYKKKEVLMIFLMQENSLLWKNTIFIKMRQNAYFETAFFTIAEKKFKDSC